MDNKVFLSYQTQNILAVKIKKKEKEKQVASILVEFIVFTKIGPMGSHRLWTSVFTMKHEILDTVTGDRAEKAAGAHELMFVPVVLVF